MADKSPSNVLYLAVLPIIHIETGATEQVLTLYPDKKFASEFFPDEVDNFISMFTRRTKFFTGGHVVSYDCQKETTPSGRVIVRVGQYVG
jgi:hypothetical protein